MQFKITVLDIYLKRVEIISTRKPAHFIHSNFIYNYQNLEATKIPTVDEWINKLIHPDNGILLSTKICELSSHEKIWRNLKYISLIEANLERLYTA